MKNISILAVLAVVVGLLAGCGGPEQVVSSDPVCLPGVGPDPIMEAAQKVLTQMEFSIEKYDFDARYIRTRPLSGAQFFQVWRQDNASSEAGALANIHSIRRIAELEVTSFAGRTCIQCRVQVQQLSVPEKPIVGFSDMASSYTKSSQNEQRLELEDSQLEKMEWLDRGLDRALEQKIVQKIQETLKKDSK